MLVKGLIVYGWGLVVSFIIVGCILLELYQLSLYACCLTLMQILLLAWLVIETIWEIRRMSKSSKSN